MRVRASSVRCSTHAPRRRVAAIKPEAYISMERAPWRGRQSARHEERAFLPPAHRGSGRGRPSRQARTARFAARCCALPAVQVLSADVHSPGLDVSAYQPNVNWATVVANGATFVYIKATEGTSAAPSPAAFVLPELSMRAHRLHVLDVLVAVQRRDERGAHPRRVPLCAPGRVVRRDAGQVLRRARRRLVRRRDHAPRRARHRVCVHSARASARPR
jgi:hypothetical protein